MRTNIVMLAVLAGLGLSSFGVVSAEAKNLSCISGIAPNEQRLIRDCGPVETPTYTVVEEVPIVPPPPPSSSLFIKNGEGGKGGGPRGRDKGHDAAAGGGGHPGGPSF